MSTAEQAYNDIIAHIEENRLEAVSLLCYLLPNRTALIKRLQCACAVPI